MRIITITIAFLLTATSTYGGVVRRSVSNKPYNNAKELLQMKGVSQRIKEDMDVEKYIMELHKECDWIMKNYDLRKSARAGEVDSLKNAKAVLSGADYGL